MPVSLHDRVGNDLSAFGKLKAGERMLIMGASSGAGAPASRSRKCSARRSIGTSGFAQKLDKLKAIGLDVAIPPASRDFAAKVKAATGGKGADLAVNGVGGSVFAECMRLSGAQGRSRWWVMSTTRSKPRSISLRCIPTGSRFSACRTRRSPPTSARRRCAGFARDVMPAIADGRIVPLIDRVFTVQGIAGGEGVHGSERNGRQDRGAGAVAAFKQQHFRHSVHESIQAEGEEAGSKPSS